MQVYDTVNKLAQEIRESEEFVNFKTAKQVLELNQELKKKISDFEMKRYEAQIKAIQTGEEDKEKIKETQDLYSEIIEQEEARKYFDAELKFNILLGDVNKIISEAVRDVM